MERTVATNERVANSPVEPTAQEAVYEKTVLNALRRRGVKIKDAEQWLNCFGRQHKHRRWITKSTEMSQAFEEGEGGAKCVDCKIVQPEIYEVCHHLSAYELADKKLSVFIMLHDLIADEFGKPRLRKGKFVEAEKVEEVKADAKTVKGADDTILR